jgi:hypothetical protein
MLPRRESGHRHIRGCVRLPTAGVRIRTHKAEGDGACVPGG